MATLAVPVENPNKALWEKGDFTRIAQTMRASGIVIGADQQPVPGDH